MSRPEPGLLRRDNIVAFIGDIFARRGAEAYLGENVTMSQHMLQAAFAAECAGEPDTVIAAALLHDIGHFTSEFPEDAQDQGIDNHHDEAGGAVLARFFPAQVVACVRGHVSAKRYLCATDRAYFTRLSPASMDSLELQGGPMTAAQRAAFAQTPDLDALLRVRRYDDAGKDRDRVTPAFAHYAPLLERLVARHADA